MRKRRCSDSHSLNYRCRKQIILKALILKDANLVVLNLAHVQAGLCEPGEPLLQRYQQPLRALGEQVSLLRVHDHVLHDAPGRLGARAARRLRGAAAAPPPAPHVDGGLDAVGDLQRLVLRRQVEAVEEAVRGEVVRGDVPVYDVAQRRAPVLTGPNVESNKASCQFQDIPANVFERSTECSDIIVSESLSSERPLAASRGRSPARPSRPRRCC